ncbi:MAG: sterol desaturase family protein [Proteobacteria bacterium]|nr:sterol desaturase family protein [Pseudomonadota bacterium]
MFLSVAADLAQGISHTIVRLLPYMAIMAVLFTALTWVSPCNKGRPWWGKRGLVTDLCYFFIVPVFSRYARIGLAVALAAFVLGITTTKGLVAFFDHGHGPLSRLPFWVQFAIYLVGSEFCLYWFHRAFHSSALWKYHAVHHSSEDIDWISASRFHPVNLIFGTILVDVVSLMSGITSDIFLVLAPFNVLSSGWVHANLDWTLGPFKYVLAGPVFHRWHHEKHHVGVNFAGTFSLFDVMFGTFYMPEGVLPQEYGIDDAAMPESFGGQLVYPIVN